VIPLEIETADADHFMELTVRNQYTTAQAVAMELDAGEAGSYMQVRINSQDRNFVLQVGEERKVEVELIISDTTLLNLDEERKTVNFTVWARSETVSDAADAQMTVTMVRTSLDDSTEDDNGGNSGAVRNVLMILLTAVVVGVGALAVMRIIGGIEEDAIDDWAERRIRRQPPSDLRRRQGCPEHSFGGSSCGRPTRGSCARSACTAC